MLLQSVGEDVLVGLHVAEPAGAAATRAGDAALGVDHDAVGLDEPLAHQRRQRQQRRRRVAPGIRQPRRADDLLALAGQLRQPVDPPLGEAVVATDVDHADRRVHRREQRSRLPGGERGEEHVQLRHAVGGEGLDHHRSGAMTAQGRHALRERLARRALAGGEGDAEGRVRGTQPQQLDPRVAADPDDPDVHGRRS